MSLNNSQDSKTNSINLHLIVKMILVVGFIIVGFVAILNYVFLQFLAKPRIRQITQMANATSIVVSELALKSFYDRDRDHLNKALDELLKETTSQESGFLQVSVILYPSGHYYASTNPEFYNRKVGFSLLKKIEDNVLPGTAVDKLNYEVDQKTVPVLQFLRNINVVQKGKEKRIAATQLLFDYGRILSETRKSLMLAGGLILALVIAIIWALFLPISLAHRKLLEALNQAGRLNLDYTLQSVSNDEIGMLFNAYNQLIKQLKRHLSKRKTLYYATTIAEKDDESPVSTGQSLRKAEITCLCARIPDISKTIGENSPERAASHIQNFLIPFDEVVQKFGGQIVKILGDKVYAFYEGINSIDNAIRASINLTQMWRNKNHERKVLGRKSLNYGIGLHSAEGIAGSISETNWKYTFFGQASSIAGYLCLCAEKEQILVSSSMMDHTSGAFQHRSVDNLEPFGLAENEVFLEISSDIPVTEIHEFESKKSTTDLTTESNDIMNETFGDEGATSQSAISNGVSTSASRSSDDASIPDMLEETLRATPLESLNPEELKDELPEESARPTGKGGKSGSGKKK